MRPRRTPATGLRLLGTLLAALLLGGVGCQSSPYGEPTRSFPQQTPQTQVVDVQVFRDGPELTLVNATATTYREADLWINQRYVHPLPVLPAGGQVVLNLLDFRDDAGERFRGGGFFAAKEPDPVVMAQLELQDGTLIGLITLPEKQSE